MLFPGFPTAIYPIIPTGVVLPFAGATLPPGGWVLCDGSTYLRNQYPALFAIIGYTYGGSGNIFQVPDLRDRVPVGVSPGSLEVNRETVQSLGGTGGAEGVTLQTTQIPPTPVTLNGNQYLLVDTESDAIGGSNYSGRGWDGVSVLGGSDGGDTSISPFTTTNPDEFPTPVTVFQP
ncbi:unnamed protein product, partial [Sphagnum balticum]